MGHLPVTTNANKHIRLISNYQANWGIRNSRPWTMAQKIVNMFVCRFGVPTIIHTKQDWNFEATLFSKMWAAQRGTLDVLPKFLNMTQKKQKNCHWHHVNIHGTIEGYCKWKHAEAFLVEPSFHKNNDSEPQFTRALNGMHFWCIWMFVERLPLPCAASCRTWEKMRRAARTESMLPESGKRTSEFTEHVLLQFGLCVVDSIQRRTQAFHLPARNETYRVSAIGAYIYPAFATN